MQNIGIFIHTHTYSWVLIHTHRKKTQWRVKHQNTKAGILGGKDKGWCFLSIFTCFYFPNFQNKHVIFTMWKKYSFKNKCESECRGAGKTMLHMSMSADRSQFPEPRSGCGTPSSWRPTVGFPSLLFGTGNVAQFSANTNKSLYKILFLFSLLGHFLGRFQGVDGRCYLASLDVSWHLCELESRGRWF